jgi:hypothetical protein
MGHRDAARVPIDLLSMYREDRFSSELIRSLRVGTVVGLIFLCADMTPARAGTNSPGVSGCPIWWPDNCKRTYERARTQALADLTNGIVKMMTCGMPLPESKEYRELLQSRLGVKLHGVSGCNVSSDEMIYLSGYNDVARPFLELRYGKNVFDALNQEAKELYEKRAKRFKNAATYVVKRGDTLTKIARANRTTVNALQEFNDLAADGLRAGQQLKLPESN